MTRVTFAFFLKPFFFLFLCLIIFNSFFTGGNFFTLIFAYKVIPNNSFDEFRNELKTTKHIVSEGITLEKNLEIDESFLRNIATHHRLKSDERDLDSSLTSELAEDAERNMVKAENTLQQAEERGERLLLEIAKASNANRDSIPCKAESMSKEKKHDLELLHIQANSTMIEAQETHKKLNQIKKLLNRDIASLRIA